GNEIDSVVGIERSRQSLALLGVEQDSQAVAQPLNRGARDEDRRLERVCRASFVVARNGGQQSVSGPRHLLPGVEQKKGTSPVSVLRLTRAAASLSEQRGLLIAGDSGNRNSLAEERRHGLAEITR